MDPFIQKLSEYGVSLFNGGNLIALKSCYDVLNVDFTAKENLSLLMNEELFANTTDSVLFVEKTGYECGDIFSIGYISDIINFQTDNYHKYVFISYEGAPFHKDFFIEDYFEKNPLYFKEHYKEIYLNRLFGSGEFPPMMVNDFFEKEFDLKFKKIVDKFILSDAPKTMYSDLLSAVNECLVIKESLSKTTAL